YFYLFLVSFFFFPHPATPEISTLSLHDALPILIGQDAAHVAEDGRRVGADRQRRQREADARLRIAFSEFKFRFERFARGHERVRSEEHTSELQSPYDLVCRLLLEKKKKKKQTKQ